MISKIFLIIFVVFSTLALSQEYKVGSGAEYDLKFKTGSSARMAIYVSKSSFNSLGIEMFMTSGLGLLMGKSMWQNFVFSMDAEGKYPLKIMSGQFQTPELNVPEQMEQRHFLKKTKGVTLTNFFFSKKEQIEKDYIAKEKIETTAGIIETHHYRKKKDGETIDFWISDKIKPISLVKLVCTNNKNPNKSYSIALRNLVSGVKPHIDPKNAIPLTKRGREILE